MRKQFRPAIKHDVVTQTYTIRDKNGVVIQVPDVIIDRLDTHYNTLEAQRIALSHSYKQVLEENEKLEQIREIKDSALKGADIKIETLEHENKKLKEEKKVNRTKASLLTEIEMLREKNEKLKNKLKD